MRQLAVVCRVQDSHQHDQDGLILLVLSVAVQQYQHATAVQEKLRLGENDEAAIEWMQQLISESSSQVMAGFMEATHRLAQALR